MAIRLGRVLVAVLAVLAALAALVVNSGAAPSPRAGEATTSEGGAPDTAAPAERAAAPAACRDRAFKLFGDHAWKKTLAWRYNPAGAARHLPRKGVIRALDRAGKSMAKGRTDCASITKRIDASIAYRGTTKARPQIFATSSGARCGQPDGRNVVGWGRIGGDSIGWTCLWWDGTGKIIDADILFEPTRQLVLGVPRNCVDSLDLQSLATHEWGHAYGLQHVSQSHAALVMPHGVAVCSLSDRTLGLGDFLGLKKLYGTR